MDSGRRCWTLTDYFDRHLFFKGSLKSAIDGLIKAFLIGHYCLVVGRTMKPIVLLLDSFNICQTENLQTFWATREMVKRSLN